MDKSNEEVFEDCNEDPEKLEQKKDDNNTDQNNTTDNQQKENPIPFTIKESQEKKNEKENPEPDKDENEEEIEKEEKVKLTEQEIKDIEEKIINERKNAGDLYKNQQYIQALNIY